MRGRNAPRGREMPCRLPPIVPDDGLGKTQCDSGDYTRTFDRCIAEFGWPEKVRLNGRLIDGRYHGVGVACFIEGGGSGPREHARMAVEADGTVAGYVVSSPVAPCVQIRRVPRPGHS